MISATSPPWKWAYIFEELIRKFAEISNETAGEHFTPREVIKLMVNLLFKSDNDILTREGIVKTLYDPACGTGGMLFNPPFGVDWKKAEKIIKLEAEKKGFAGRFGAGLPRINDG